MPTTVVMNGGGGGGEEGNVKEKLEYIYTTTINKSDIYYMGFDARCGRACLWGIANIKGADQPVHLHSLISAFVIR